MDSCDFGQNAPLVKTQEQLNRDKRDELRATELAKEALAREGLHDPYQTPTGKQVDYETAREYSAKLSSYTCYYRNKLRTN